MQTVAEGEGEDVTIRVDPNEPLRIEISPEAQEAIEKIKALKKTLDSKRDRKRHAVFVASAMAFMRDHPLEKYLGPIA